MYLIKLYRPHLKLDTDSLKYAKVNLGENENTVEKHVEYIKNWLLKQTEIKSKTSRDFLIRFLRVAKYDYPRTQILIENYWKNRTLYKDFFGNKQFVSDKLVKYVCNHLFFLSISVKCKKIIKLPSVWQMLEFAFQCPC
jgi:hypothetical protein